jgi:hypothetical protein
MSWSPLTVRTFIRRANVCELFAALQDVFEAIELFFAAVHNNWAQWLGKGQLLLRKTARSSLFVWRAGHGKLSGAGR